MAIELQLHRDGRAPLYRQIADQIRAAIREGRLRPGVRLPTVRVLAEELQITRVTVHKAFRELQAAGFLENNPSPSDEQISTAMNGILCRCMAYPRIRKAIKTAASGEGA